jgi:hypothetical protein
MKLIKFIEKFPDEQSCRDSFKDYRLKVGVKCRKCQCTKHYWMSSIEQFQCTECRTRTTLRSGTVMESSNLPFRIWFLVLHLMTSTKKGFSAKEVQRQVGLKRYEPVWYMMQKIRMAMGARDERYLLSGATEMDEGFFTTVDSENRGKRKKKLKRGRGSQQKTPVMVMAESKKSKTRKKGRPIYSCGFFKMEAMGDLSANTIEMIAKNSLDPGCNVRTDNYPSYSKLRQVVKKHTAKTIKPKDAGKELPWVHTAISNAKRNILNNFHHVDDSYLQNYLDEFTYKLNRRNILDQLFDRLIIACISFSWTV